MSEEEKARYYKKLLRDSEAIANKITHQIASCEQVRAQMRETIKQNLDVINLYKTEHDEFRARMEYRKHVYAYSSFKYQEMAARNLKNPKAFSDKLGDNGCNSFILRRPQSSLSGLVN